jgi:hypothetical protein
LLPRTITFLRKQVVAESLFCHPEFISGSHNLEDRDSIKTSAEILHPQYCISLQASLIIRPLLHIIGINFGAGEILFLSFLNSLSHFFFSSFSLRRNAQ